MPDLSLAPALPERPDIARPVAIGAAVVGLFFGVFGLWAALAPLSTAAIAPGEVIVETKRKTVQHLEGGIVRDILVRDGDVVKAGQVLVRLDRTQPGTMLSLIEGRVIAARALEARLTAEREDRDSVTYPEEIRSRAAEPEVAAAIESQNRIFAARRDDLVNKIDILRKKDSQVRAEIDGLKAQIAAADRQLKLIASEVDGIRGLVERGLVARPRLLALERRAAEIEGERGRNVADIARAEQSIGETELKVQEVRTTRLNETVAELREVQGQLFDLGERYQVSRDVLSRTEVRAPIDGTVVGLRVATAGGVLSPGEAILDIVPSEDRLVIDARVRPEDIDVVRPGLRAEVRFTAFSQRNTRPFDAAVESVSADRLSDRLTPEGYFLARIVLTAGEEQFKGAKLHPGMQAETMIITGTRSALSYFLKPLTDSFNRAFRED